MTDSRPRAAIFDIDGTLCDVRRIRHYVIDPERKDFDAFHRASSFCPPNGAVLDLLHQVRRRGIVPIAVTARPEIYRDVTQGWLDKHSIPTAGLLMRKSDDRRKDHVIKAEILAVLRNTWQIVLAVDDNPDVLGLWRHEGIETITVPGWEDVALIELDRPVNVALLKWLIA